MKNHKKLWKLLPFARAIAVLSAVGIVTTLVTFAAIQSTGSALAGNTIQTATAALQISHDGTTYTDSMPGYDFTGLVPGGAAQPAANGGYEIWIKNTGTAQLKPTLTVPTPPVVNGTVDLSKVSVVLNPANSPLQTVLLSDLIAGTVNLTSGTLGVGMSKEYRIQVSMSSDAVTGNSASITGLDLSFGGTL